MIFRLLRFLLSVNTTSEGLRVRPFTTEWLMNVCAFSRQKCEFIHVMEKVEIHPSMSDARTGPGSFSPTRQANNKAIKILKHDDDAS